MNRGTAGDSRNPTLGMKLADRQGSNAGCRNLGDLLGVQAPEGRAARHGSSVADGDSTTSAAWRASAPRFARLALTLPIMLSGCGESELRASQRALETAAPVEFAAWQAAVEVLENSTRSVSEMERFEMEARADALRERIVSAETRRNARIRVAVESRNETLRAAQAAQDHYVETWNARKGDLRFGGHGHGIGVGNSARFAIQKAETTANRTRRDFEAADAAAERVTETAQAEYLALAKEASTEFLTSLSPEQRALMAALDAEQAAAARLSEAAPEAWAALEAHKEQLAELPGLSRWSVR